MKDVSSLVDLWQHRADIFSAIPQIVKARGQKSDALMLGVTSAMKVVASCPSFLLTNREIDDMAKTPGWSMKKIHHKGKFKVPFDHFSIVVDSEHQKSISVYAVVDPASPETPIDGITDCMIVFHFKKEARINRGKWQLRSWLLLACMGDIETPLRCGVPSSTSPFTDHDDNRKQAALASARLSVINSAMEVRLYEPAVGSSQTTHKQHIPKMKAGDVSYRLIKMTALKKKGAYQGGHHASPAQHERRGHNRTYTHPRYTKMRGQTVRISATTVGSPANGEVVKDYTV